MPEWSMIESAPKARTVLLFAVTDVGDDGQVKNWKMQSGYWSDSYGAWVWEGRPVQKYEIQPTHWRPMPDPPVR